MNENPPLRIAFAGEVDHGKSTLIGRLMLETRSLAQGKLKEVKKIAKELGQEACLAFLADQLKEERENSLTIDTTQIFLKTKKRKYVIIDNPGHVEFIKNMMTGTSSAEAAVLVADITRGIEEQTRRHAYVIKMFGIETVIVAVNKIDLVQYDENKFSAIKSELSKLFSAMGIHSYEIIPVSAKDAINISRVSSKTQWYKGLSLVGLLDNIRLKSRISQTLLRFPLQDVYQINGEPVAIGKIAAGKAQKDQEVILLPSNQTARIETIKVFNQKRNRAGQGESIGLTLQPRLKVKRGDIISSRENPPPLKKYFVANIFWMSHNSLKKESRVTLRCSTQKVSCLIERIEKRINTASLEVLEENADELNANEVGVIKIAPAGPLIVENFQSNEELGRFVLEENDQLLGVGIVTANS